MRDQTKLAFRSELQPIPIDQICPLKEPLTPWQRAQKKYRQIATSIQHIGLVEPPVVFPNGKDQYLLVDGHTRLDVLRNSGATVVECLVATDDESYTYNKRVNYLPPIAEHYMILKALTNGVTERRIAETLDIDIAEIRKKRDLLNGICPEAVDLLKNRRVTSAAFSAVRRMKPVRQIRCAELMISANNYTISIARAFLSVTPDDLLVDPPGSRRPSAVPNSTKTTMELEAEALVDDLKHAEESYAADMFDLSTFSRYFVRLFENSRVLRYLTKHHPDILAELQQLISDLEDEAKKGPASEKSTKLQAVG